MLQRAIDVILAAGIAGAGALLWGACGRYPRLRPARWAAAMVAVAGVAAFLHAANAGTPPRAALLDSGRTPYAIPALMGAFFILPLGWIASVVRAGIPSLREGSLARASSQAVALTTCVALLLTSLPRSVQPSGYASKEERWQAFDRSLRAIEDGVREMPRDTWDPDYVVRMVGRDPQKLFRWVKNNTYWIPYHGVLRGPIGVLMDRQGNSLDRAILLATLLQEAGYTARIAHGELTREQALELLPNLEAARTSAFTPNTASDRKGISGRLKTARYGNTANNGGSDLQTQRFAHIADELRSRVSEQTERLLKLVPLPNRADVWERSLDAAMASLIDHWWVQLQSGPNWVDLDLLTSNPGVAAVPARETTAIADLAADLHHTVTIRVIAEQWSGGTLREHEVLEQVLRPSDLYGRSVMLQFWPSSWIAADNATSQHSRAGALAQNKWDVVLAVDSYPLSTGLLLDNGDNPDAIAKGGPFGSIAGAFGRSMGLAGKNDNRQLSAVWIEYEIGVPGEKPRTIRRTVFDLLGPAARATSSPTLALDETMRLTRSLALTMKTEILPMASGLSPVFVSALLAHNVLADRDLFAFLIRGELPAGNQDVEHLYERSEPPLSSLYGLALARLALAAKGEIFIDRPNILSRHQYPVAAGQGIALLDATDIVAGEVGIGLSVHDPFAARIAQGVLDSNAESLLQLGQSISVSTGDAFAASRSWSVVAPAQDAASVGRVNLPVDARRAIGSDLNAGYTVVAPEKVVTVEDGDFAGWWRINPTTGDTLGVTANGWGGTLPFLLVAWQELAEQTSEDAPKIKAAPFWKARIKTFAVAFAANYAWCVAPLVQKHGDSYLKQPSESWGVAGSEVKLHHSLGIWEGAIKPIAKDSVGECAGDSIIVAGLTAWLLPVGVAAGVSKAASRVPRAPHAPNVEGSLGTGEANAAGNGGSGTKTMPGLGPNEPGSGPPESGNLPEANNSTDEPPCGDTQPGEPPAPEMDQGPEGPPNRSEYAKQLKDEVFATEQAALDAEKDFIKAHGEMLRYRAQAKPIYNGNGDILGYEGPAFDHNVYEQLEKVAEQKFQNSQEASARAIQASRAWNAFVAQQLKQGAGGLCGGGAGGGRQASEQAQPAANPQANVDPFSKTEPDGPPTVPDPNVRWQGNTRPGGLDPPTPINNPSGKTIPGPGLPNTPNEPSGKTLPGIGPPPNPGTPRSWDGKVCPWCSTVAPVYADSSSSDPSSQSVPQISGQNASPAQKTRAGLAGVASALGGTPQ